MKKELPYYKIGSSFGGNQNWFRDWIMKMGGCAAATACDACINLALYEGKKHLYPYDIHRLNKEDYIKFSMKMKPYLTPRFQGIDRLELFVEGYARYLNDLGESNVQLMGYSGDMPADEAVTVLKKQIDHGIMVPYLLLKHKNKAFRLFVWHWFAIVGYEELNHVTMVKIATYGNSYWVPFHDMWSTGYQRKGGMIIIKEAERLATV